MRLAETNRVFSILAISLLICLSGSRCHVGDRIQTTGVIQEIKSIRTAENAFRSRFLRYGSLKELCASGFLDGKFLDEQVLGYKFSLLAEKDRYSLKVYSEPPLQKSTENLEQSFSFYLDETGIIRASVDAQKPANAYSSAIAEQ